MNKKVKGATMLKIILKGSFIVLGILTVLTGAVLLWAFTSTSTSLAARGIMWGDSDVGDQYRFPSRKVGASTEPVSFEAASPSWLSDLTIEAKPLAIYLEETNTTAFIILQDDKLLFEGYYNGSNRETNQTSLSVAKSFASTLVGIAIDEGYIDSLDDPITAYIPELSDRDLRFDDITIRHLITMSSGISYHITSSPIDDGTITYYSPDLRAAALASEISEAPGTRFLYNNYNPLLVGMVLERATGMSVSEYLETRLWGPMGAEGDGSWNLDSEESGFEKMESGLNGRAIDFAKLGWLFLNQGRNDDRQVIPADWVEEAARTDITTDPAPHYQYFWWVDVEHGAFYAEGNFCQFIYVVPDAGLVLVRFGNDCGGVYWTGLLGDIGQWIEEQLRK
jgi:CubicO group peptidase (beta-lactamase class C family)